MILGKFRWEQRPKTRFSMFDGDSRAAPPPPRWSPPRPFLRPRTGHSRNGLCWCSGDVVFQDWSGAPSAFTCWCMGWWCGWHLGVLTTMAPAVARWFTTSHSVLPTLSRGLFVLWGWWEFAISP